MKLQKIIVSGILENNGSVLIAKRSLSKKIAPGKYHIPGGHVEFGENPEQALAREFMEEFQLTISAKSVVRAFSYVIENAHTIGITYTVVTDDDLSKIKFDTRDTEKILWVDESMLHSYFPEADNDMITLRQYYIDQPSPLPA